ncbi:Calmodulin-binding transcription activator [Trichinella spiralis]|uniref:Calmodulin-binding transcription activator n=1 Tax=Trichinella spiralis TaxID=6334 RepID=A0ABR3K4D2_TRISP
MICWCHSSTGSLLKNLDHNHFPLLAAIYFTMDSTNSIELKPYDSEQQLYMAACIIQNAYRHYRQPLIQSYYRRYKQHCYFKRIQRAAILIQKQFRKYRSVRAYSKNCITANDVLFWKQTLAAMRIQNAFRIHLKRHSAARIIQKFMRNSKNKLHWLRCRRLEKP